MIKTFSLKGIIMAYKLIFQNTSTPPLCHYYAKYRNILYRFMEKNYNKKNKVICKVLFSKKTAGSPKFQIIKGALTMPGRSNNQKQQDQPQDQILNQPNGPLVPEEVDEDKLIH